MQLLVHGSLVRKRPPLNFLPCAFDYVSVRQFWQMAMQMWVSTGFRRRPGENRPRHIVH